MYNYIHIKDKVSTINKFVPSGREIVLLFRGLSRSYKGWLGLEEDLSEKFDVICIDLPGVGLSKNEEYLYSIKEMAGKFLEVINNLRLDKFYIVAPSLGSLVVYELIQSIPLTKIEGLVIIVPSHSGLGINRLSPLGIRTLGTAGFVSKEVKLAMLRELLVGKTIDGSDPFAIDVHWERKWKNQLMQDNEELGTKGQLAQVFAAAKYTSKKGLDYIKKNQIPLIVMIATNDRMIPVSHKRAVYEYLKHPYSELIEMENSGHDFVVTHKNQVNEVITKFISEKGKFPVKVVNNEEIISIPKKSNNKGILFFLSTLIFGILLMLTVNKYKKK
jgi:pimeloyl-ACP methyl ester carboxylesterase